MAKVSIFDIKEEIVVFLRNKDIISIADRGVTTSQDTGTFAADNSYTLAINPTLVKNVRNVNVDSSDLTFGTDYKVNYETGEITFTSAQTGAYIIDYDQANQDRIFPDFPQADLKLNQFPRIAVDIIGGETEEFELGAGSNFSEYDLTVVAYDADQKNVELMIAAIRSNFQDNKKTFFYSTFITPRIMGPILVSPFGENKILQRNQDFRIRFIYED